MPARTPHEPKPLVNPENRPALDKLAGVMWQIRTEFGTSISVRRVHALVAIGLHGKSTHRRIAMEIDAIDETVRTDLQALGPLDRHGQPGHGMLQFDREEAKQDRYIWDLSDKGRATLDRLAARLKD